MKLNQNVVDVELSGIRRFNEWVKDNYQDCLYFTLGDPDFDTPDRIKNKLVESIAANETHYPPGSGLAELRQAIAAFEKRAPGGYSADEVIVTEGATGALFSSLFTLICPGDEVIVPTPAYTVYKSMIELASGVCIEMPVEADHFQITETNLRNHVSAKTKAIILTSPNNPTGMIFDQSSLESIYNVAKAYNLYIICDDVYNQLVYAPYVSMRQFQDIRAQLIIVQSFSKPYAMTGWRIGYLLADRELIEQITKVNQFMITGIASFVQRAAIEALQCDVQYMVDSYRRRGIATAERMQAMGLEVDLPQGAFYLFPSIKQFGIDSITFCKLLVEQERVVLIPGVYFGGEGFVRFSYCKDEADLSEAMDRMERFVQRLAKERGCAI